MDNRRMLNDEKRKFLRDWNTARFLAMEGPKRLGHDIPITAYTAEEGAKRMTQERKALKIKQRW